MNIHFQKAVIAEQAGETLVATELYKRAVAVDPSCSRFYFGMGNALYSNNNLDEASVSFGRSVVLESKQPGALTNLGLILQEVGELEAAICVQRMATAVGPRFAPAHVNLAAALLRKGQWLDAWAEYEWRRACTVVDANSPDRSKPIWKGETLRNKTLLIYEEGGFGDTINFIKLAERLRSARKIIAYVRKPLARMVRSLEFIDQVVTQGAPVPAFDYQVSTQSLLGRLGIEPNSIIPSGRYLSPPAALRTKWASRVGVGSRIKVGVVWAGSSSFGASVSSGYDGQRSLKLEILGELMAVQNIDWYSLQMGSPRSELRTNAGLNLVDLMDQVEDFADTAALIDNLDLVIGVDTSVVHLAGALGKPVWVLSRFDGCWRWLRNRDDSPWYASMRLFRQTRRGDWVSVIEQVRNSLNNLLVSPQSSRSQLGSA